MTSVQISDMQLKKEKEKKMQMGWEEDWKVIREAARHLPTNMPRRY